jgi:hypothetical protein
MLALSKSEVDFSRGHADGRTGHLLLATHPHLGIREWLYASTPCLRILAAANLYSPLLYLVPSNKPRAGKGPSSGSIGPGLSSMLETDFRERVTGEARATPLLLTPVDTERLGSNVQTPPAPELVFHALLAQDGAHRLELARA